MKIQSLKHIILIKNHINKQKSLNFKQKVFFFFLFLQVFLSNKLFIEGSCLCQPSMDSKDGNLFPISRVICESGCLNDEVNFKSVFKQCSVVSTFQNVTAVKEGLILRINTLDNTNVTIRYFQSKTIRGRKIKNKIYLFEWFIKRVHMNSSSHDNDIELSTKLQHV